VKEDALLRLPLPASAGYAFNLPGALQIVVGAAVPVGLTSDCPDCFYLSFEHPFVRNEHSVLKA